MSLERVGQYRKPNKFEGFIIGNYLQYGSVDEMFRANRHSLAITEPGVYHILDRWGIERTLGRANTPLAECLEFLVRRVEERIPLETLYRRMPPSFQPTMATLHRMYREAKKIVAEEAFEKRKMRRVGTALVITNEQNPYQFLIGRDVAPPRLDVGKPFGSISLPMGFSKRTEGARSVTRVVQQEVFTNKVIEDPIGFREEASGFLEEPEPFMFIDIADVRVSVYHLQLPDSLSGLEGFSSFKLKGFRYVTVEELLEKRAAGNYLIRQGVLEITEGYLNYLSVLEEVDEVEPFFVDSFFNQKLRLLAAEEKAVV